MHFKSKIQGKVKRYAHTHPTVRNLESKFLQGKKDGGNIEDKGLTHECQYRSRIYNVRLNDIELLILHNNHITAWWRSTNDKEDDK